MIKCLRIVISCHNGNASDIDVHNSMLVWRDLSMTIFNLQKRVAFITGGNGGIGLGMAKGLAGAGAAVAVAGRNKTKAQSALSELRALGAQAEFVEMDVLKEASCRAA